MTIKYKASVLVKASVVVALIIIAIFNFKYWMPGMSHEIFTIKSKNIIFDNKSYLITKEINGEIKVCKPDSSCINGEIKSIKTLNNQIYFICNLYTSRLKAVDANGKEFETGPIIYQIFDKGGGRNTVEEQNDLPFYFHTDNENLIFNSKKDKEKLSNQDQEIFKSLEMNPKIMVN